MARARLPNYRSTMCYYSTLASRNNHKGASKPNKQKTLSQQKTKHNKNKPTIITNKKLRGEKKQKQSTIAILFSLIFFSPRSARTTKKNKTKRSFSHSPCLSLSSHPFSLSSLSLYPDIQYSQRTSTHTTL